MDYIPTDHQQNISTTTPSTPADQAQHQAQAQSTTSTEAPLAPGEVASSGSTRSLRSSVRVRAAAKQKAPQQQDTTTELSSSASAGPSSAIQPQVSTSASTSRTTRATTQAQTQRSKRFRDTDTSLSNKGKGKETAQESSRPNKRAKTSTAQTSASLTINEPTRDPKGKKRALPEAESDEELPASSISASTKRPRTSAYSLRSRTEATEITDMPKKNRSSTGVKGKTVPKTKAMASTSGSQLNDDEDVVMGEPDFGCEPSDHGDEGGEAVRDEMEEHDDDDDGEGVEGESNPDGEDNEGDGGAIGTGGFGGLDESAAMAIFGGYRQFGSFMLSLSSRLKTMLANIKPTADPTTRLLTLQELSELLSISTEDTLAGSFPVEQFVKQLVRILGGRGGNEDDEDGGGNQEPDPASQDEDAQLAAALAMSHGGAYQGDENLEAQVLACRCLANLMEALPGVAHTVVYHGAIPVLCSKLIEISYIDLAEQTLSTLEKISEEFPSAIVRENGLAALLNYLDFFSIAVQRTALQAASNCCRNVSTEHFASIRGVWPIIRNCLSYSDQRLVEFACVCVIRVIDAYHRSSSENLEELVDVALISAVNNLLLPAGGSPLITVNTYTLLLRALSTSARASPKIALTLLEAGIVETLYQILTGVLPPTSVRNEEQGNASGGQGLGGGLADMTVMENLAHRPKEQVEEALSLISELMPPLPKDGVFDHRGYTEKAFLKMVKAKGKADRAAARQQAALAAGLIYPGPAQPAPVSATSTPPPIVAEATGDAASSDAAPQDSSSQVTAAKVDRTEMMRSKPGTVGRFMQLIVPILVDVYAASVIIPVRVKSLTALLKTVSFLDAPGLKQILHRVPVASFASSILSSKDHPSLVIGALQLADLLLMKVPEDYKPAFRREGVFHEVETLAARALISKPKDKDKEKDKDTSEASSPAPSDAASLPPPIATAKKASSSVLDPDDAVTIRCRVIRFKHFSGPEENEADGSLKTLKRLMDSIATMSTEKDIRVKLQELADLFATSRTSVSSFELMQSGVVDGLLQFATDPERSPPMTRRQELLYDAFTSRKPSLLAPESPLSVFVKKLQESLTRMESFEVVTASQGVDDSKRSSPSLLARQIRLRLVAGDDSDVPKNLHNIVVSIHAIATFQALHDYLRPRVSGILPGASRLSSMLAALAASGYSPGSSRPPIGEAGSSAGLSISAPAPSSAPPMASSSSAPPQTASTAESASPSGRRRSLRLSAKNSSVALADQASAPPLSSSAPPPSMSSMAMGASNAADTRSTPSPATPSRSDTVMNDPEMELGADFTDDEVDAEVFEEEAQGDEAGTPEKTVVLSVEDGGSRLVAQTPDGTRVATPSQVAPTPTPSARLATSNSRASYAAALKAKPVDWHLEFSIDDHPLPLDMTIYGGVYQAEMRKKNSPVPSVAFWQNIYTVKFKKVAGPSPVESRADSQDASTKTRAPSPTLSSLPEDAPYAKILRLLRVFHKLNAIDAERAVLHSDKPALAESAFVNNKLSAKLTRQLEEPMIVASSCLPDWALDLPQHFPFLFPFATRYNFLQSTSFGYARLIMKLQSQQTRAQDSSRRDESIGFLGRLQRQKVRISRQHLFESAVKVFELYGSSSSVLEVEYFEEVGTGLGPTLEFYSLVSREFVKRSLKIWHDADQTHPGPYVHHPHGLYPAPIGSFDSSPEGGQKRLHVFQVMGQFVAKAMLDSRIIDIHMNRTFVKLILGEEVPLTIASLKTVDKELGNSIAKLQAIASSTPQLPADKLARKVALVESVSVEDLALDFTIPGYDIELRPGGRNMVVTSENVNEYINEVLDAIVGQGVQAQAKAFREGFSKVFSISDLQSFSADEIVMLLGNSDEDWSIETLSEVLKADHGFNVESRAIHDLIQIMAEYDAPTRRDYLQFITGSPKLPIGGFRGLNPSLTVVRKPHEAPLTADDYLPSVMTCVNYLKLPEYSSKEIMKERLQTAMKEGVGSFHLS